MMERMLDKNFSEENVQRIVNALCNKMNINNMVIMPMPIEESKSTRALGMYHERYKGFRNVCRVLAEDDLIVVLHELAHHIQYMCYLDSYMSDTVHGNTFTLACNKIAKTCRELFGEKDIFIGTVQMQSEMGELVFHLFEQI